MHLRTRNVNTAFTELVKLFHSGEYSDYHGTYNPPIRQVASRNGPVKVLEEPIIITYERPTERVLFNAARDANPFFHLYESLWMLAGRNDVDSVAYYASNMRNYSDDGKTLNGAYGYRWRHAGPDKYTTKSEEYTDQLHILVEHLKADPTSRRAVLQMWNVEDDLLKIGEKCKQCNGTGTYKGLYTPDDPASDYVGEPCEDCDGKGALRQSKDVCCNLSVMFSIRPGDERTKYSPSDAYRPVRLLDMTVTNRSNDLVWGALGANYVHFTVLQEYMAARLGAAVGLYHHFSNNMHVYTDRFDAEKWLAAEEDSLMRVPEGMHTVPLVADPATFEREVVQFVQQYANPQCMASPFTRYTEPFLATVAQPMLDAFLSHKMKTAATMEHAGKIAADDWRIAATEWLQRRKK